MLFNKLYFFLSITLLGVNFFGISLPPKTTASTGNIPGYNFPIYSKDTLINLMNGEPIKHIDTSFIFNLNEVVFKTIPHGSPAELKFQNNWVLYILSFIKGDSFLFTQNSKYIILGDAAVCSQKARLVNEIAKKNRIKARFITFTGHVVSEVKINQDWYILDPDFGIVLPFGFSDLKYSKNHSTIRTKLLMRGFKKSAIEDYVAIVSNNKIKIHNEYEAHEPKLWMIERVTTFLSWVIPTIALLSSAYKLFYFKLKI